MCQRENKHIVSMYGTCLGYKVAYNQCTYEEWIPHLGSSCLAFCDIYSSILDITWTEQNYF